MKKILVNLFCRLRMKVLRNGLKVLGVCGACFFIEACYGTPQADYSESPIKDVDVSGTIKSENGSFASNIPVLLTNGNFGDTLRTITDKNGNYIFYDVRYSKQPYHLVINDASGYNGTVDFEVNKSDLLADQKQIDYVLK